MPRGNEINSDQEFIPIDMIPVRARQPPRPREVVRQAQLNVDEMDARDASSSSSAHEQGFINADPEMAYEPQQWRFVGDQDRALPDPMARRQSLYSDSSLDQDEVIVTLKELAVTIRKKFKDEDGPYKYLWQTCDLIEAKGAFEAHTVAFPKFLSSISLMTVVTFVGFHPFKLLNSNQIIEGQSISNLIGDKISNLSPQTKLLIENNAKIFFIEDEFS